MNNNKVLIVFWTTSRCNLKCKYCYAAAAKEKSDMDFETAVKVIEYFKERPMKIQFAGGEPLLNYSLIRNIYSYIKEKGYNASFQMQTNGTLIDFTMAKELKEMKISMGVSMDGPPDINEDLRGSTDKLIQGIKCLAKAGVTVNLNAVVTQQNIDRIPELADVALYFGNVAGIGLDLLRDAGRAKENSKEVQRVTPTELKKSLTLLYERCNLLYKYSGKKIHIRSIEEAKVRLNNSKCFCNKEYCFASCGQSFVVLPQGDIYPCGSMINNSEYYMGNIHKDKIIKSLAIPKQEAGECSNCEYKSFCSGGCPSRLIVNKEKNITETLDCALKKASFEIVKKNES